MLGKREMNSQLFDCFTVRILGELYEQFPIKKTFDVRTFDKEACVQAYKEQDRLNYEELIEILYSTFVFLEENELLLFDKSKNGWMSGYFTDVGLTLKGLQLLKKEPKSIKPDYESIGDKLIKSLKEKGISSASSLVNEKLWGLLS